MARKGSLIGSMKAAAELVQAETQAPFTTGAGSVQRSAEDMTTTAVHIPKRTLSLLRRVAVARADRLGGRPSVSAVITDLVEATRIDLEKEVLR